MGQKPCPGEAPRLHNCGRFPITTSLRHYIITSQRHNMTTSQYHNTTASQHHDITTSQHHYIPTSELHYLMHRNSTTSQHPYITASQHRASIIPGHGFGTINCCRLGLTHVQCPSVSALQRFSDLAFSTPLSLHRNAFQIEPSVPLFLRTVTCF